MNKIDRPGADDERIVKAISERLTPAVVPLGAAHGLGTRAAEFTLYRLREGLCGWEVTDCVVTMTSCSYSVPDGTPSRRGPLSTETDFRNLTPLVVMQALEQAGTTVCEPVLRVRLEIPTKTIGAALALLARVGAAANAPSLHGELSTIETVLPAARAHDLHRQLPAVTGGEGVFDSDFEGDRPVVGARPERRRTTANPLNRGEYLLHLARRLSRG